MEINIRRAQAAAAVIGDERVEEISPGGLSAASTDALALIVAEGDRAFAASAVEVSNRALDAKRLGSITASAAADVTAAANYALGAHRTGDYSGALRLLGEARDLLDTVA